MRVVIVVFGVIGVVLLCIVYARDPSEGYGLPPCRFKEVTGYHCPGCGGTRSVHALLHGRVGMAFYYNPLFIAGLAFGGLALGWLKLRHSLGAAPLQMSTRQGVALAIVVIGAILGFGVIRNFSWYPWLKAPIHENR
ncbi:MAG: DUF2752 domain-containing protein [Verrucomicrobiae bacterium]|nr:DUF2752 domain-containing protein [Verrucomicrobiae bacterium]